MNCTIENCEVEVMSKGLCRKHYDASRRPNKKYGVCTVEGCTTRADGQLCGKHYAIVRAERMPACAADDCTSNAVTKGLCYTHYARLRKHGDITTVNPSRIIRTPEQVRDHIKENVVVDENGCWIWQKTCDPAGYGRLTWGGIPYAHRASYTAFNGDIPEGMHVCHSCDVPSCVNPGHLWIGTPADNMRDRDAKGRDRFSREKAGVL